MPSTVRVVPVRCRSIESEATLRALRPDEARFRPTPDAVHERVGNEVVLVHLRTNRIFSLNQTGARLWELIAQGMSRAEMKQTLLDEFDVGADQLDAELDALLTSLTSERLIEAVDE